MTQDVSKPPPLPEWYLAQCEARLLRADDTRQASRVVRTLPSWTVVIDCSGIMFCATLLLGVYGLPAIEIVAWTYVLMRVIYHGTFVENATTVSRACGVVVLLAILGAGSMSIGTSLVCGCVPGVMRAGMYYR